MAIHDFIIPLLCFKTFCFDDAKEFCLNPPCPRADEEEFQYRHHTPTFLSLVEDLKTENLLVTTVQNGGLSGVKKENGVLVGTGVAFDLLNILRDKYKFNYTVVEPQENTWTSKKTAGVLEMLIQERADLSAGFFPVLADFWNATTFSPALDTGEWVAMMRRPKESASGSGLLAPFTLPVWMLILVSLLIVGPVIYLLILLKAYICRNDDNETYPLPSCIWFVYGALLKQGTTLSPKSDSPRILFATWWLFITILTAYYTANLTAFLTLSKFTLPIQRPEDIGQKHYKWVTNKGNSISDIIASEHNVPSSSGLKGLGDVLGKPYACPEKEDSEILSQYVEKQQMIYVREKPIVQYVMYEDYKDRTKRKIDEDIRCVYVTTRFNLTVYPRAFAYSKSFKYHEIFDSEIQHLVESGIIRFKQTEYLPNTEICPLNLGSKERQLRNADLSMTYIIVGVGFAVATVVFLTELFITYCYHKREFQLTLPNLKNNINDSEKINFHKNEVVTHGYNNTLPDNNNFYGFNKAQPHYTSKFLTPPPPYHSLFMKSPDTHKMSINGRDYWVNGKQLIPMRTPSALLFQFTN